MSSSNSSNSDNTIDSDCESENKNTGSPAKKRKRQCTFNKSWIELPDYSRWLKKGKTENEAHCILCKKYFSIGAMGISSIKQHMASQSHKTRSQASTSSQIMENFFCKETSDEQTKVIYTELTQVYHAVKHNLSYNSIDCQNKLNSKMFNDSKIAQKISCGRTKAAAYVTSILGPFALEQALLQLKNLPLAVQIDASNRKNVKLFPICVQYFSRQDGLCNKVLDFFENADETADGMFETVKKSLSDLNLPFSTISALNADNTNANFGKKHSLFTNLVKENSNIMKGNCHAHIIHNCFKHAITNLEVDIENLILKIYAHFSNSAKRRDHLKDFAVFVETTYKDVLRHVVTRWLSMKPCIERLILIWPALNSYFLSSPENCSKQLLKILNISSESTEIPLKIEIYLLFVLNMSEMFEKTIKLIENNKCTVCDIFKIFSNFKNQLTQRKDNLFFGYKISEKLKEGNLLKKEKDDLEKDFVVFLENALEYLNKWFNFEEDNWLNYVSLLSLSDSDSCPNFKNLDTIIVIENMNLKEKLQLNMDTLFEEIVALNANYATITKHINFPIDCYSSDKWHFIFKTIKEDLNNLFKIVSFFLSIPASSAFVERVFSVVNLKWSDERNRCEIELIKNELLIYFNLKQNCSEFLDLIKNNTVLLKSAKNQQKYKFKK